MPEVPVPKMGSVVYYLSQEVKMSKPKEPSYEDQERCLDLRKKTKTGSYISPIDSRFVRKMFEKYPEWYSRTEETVFMDTRPFGSSVTYRKGG